MAGERYRLIVKNGRALMESLGGFFNYLLGIKDVSGAGTVTNGIVDWTIQHRTQTTAQWGADTTTVLLRGQLGIEDTGDGNFKAKIGNGSGLWSALGYISGSGGSVSFADLTGSPSDNAALASALNAKLDVSAYNDRYKGKYTSLAALQSAHPTGTAGDYAQVDPGSGTDVKNYNWDDEEGWILGGDGSGATNTDQLIEGSANLYFTAARVRAVVLTGLSLATIAAISAADTVLSAFGKLQAQITDIYTLLSLPRRTKIESVNVTPHVVTTTGSDEIAHVHQIGAGPVSANGCIIMTSAKCGATSSGNTKTYKMWINSVADLTGSPVQIATVTSTTNAVSLKFERFFNVISNTSILCFAGTSASASETNSSSAFTTPTVPSLSAGFYIIITANRAVGTDTVTVYESHVNIQQP